MKEREEKINSMTFNNEKIAALNKQKVEFLEGDIMQLKDKNELLKQELKEGKTILESSNNVSLLIF